MKKITGSIAIVALALIFAVPAMATDWNFYGSARMQTGWLAEDYGDKLKGGREDDFGAVWALQGNSRIGANVKHDALAGRFEYGSTPNLRLLYGTFTTGDFEFKIGQDYTPAGSYFYSNQIWDADTDLLNCGQAYNGRRPMLQVKVGGLKVALVQPHSLSDLGSGGDIDLIVPKLEISYGFKTDAFFMDFYCGAQTYEIDFEKKEADKDKDDDNVNVTSAIGGFGLGFNAGPVFIKTGAYAGINTAQYGLWQLGDANAAFVNKDGSNDVDNCVTFGGLFVIGASVSESVTLETGVGYLTHELDTDGDVDADASMTAYLNATITFMKNFFVVPEVGFIDRMDDKAGVDEGADFYFGAKWQINF